MTRDERLVAAVDKIVGSKYKAQITMLRGKLHKMEALKNNWKLTAERYKKELEALKK